MSSLIHPYLCGRIADEWLINMTEKNSNVCLQSKKSNYIKKYVITTYLVFWGAIMLVGILFILCGQKKSVMNWGTVVASWVPTIILMCYFDKLFPDIKRCDWIKNAFRSRLKVGMLLFVTVCIAAAVVGTYVITVQNNSTLSFDDLKGITVHSLIPTIFFAITQGATGEEAGWRGFLQGHFEKKYNGNLLKSALVVGVIWSFWHTPLWFITGLPPVQMLIYIGTFIVGNLCLSVIIAVCYEYCRNLIVPMWIHFLSNVLSTIIEPYVGDVKSVLMARCWLAVFYITIAIIFALWYLIRQPKNAENQGF